MTVDAATLSWGGGFKNIAKPVIGASMAICINTKTLKH
jgi:hypothetical protein